MPLQGYSIAILYPLLNRKSELNIKNKILLYKVVIRPIFMYGCPAYREVAKTHIKKLQILQNKTLKLLLDRPFYERTETIHEETDILKIHEYMEYLLLKYDLRLLHNP